MSRVSRASSTLISAVNVFPVFASVEGHRSVVEASVRACTAAHQIQPKVLVRRGICLQRRGCDAHRDTRGLIKLRQQGLREPAQVPDPDGRLVAEAVAPAGVDGTEHGLGIERLPPSARAVVDRLPGERHIVRIHHPVHEAEGHPAGDGLGLRRDHRRQQRQRRGCPRRGAADSAGLGRARQAGARVHPRRPPARPGGPARRSQPASARPRPGPTPRPAASGRHAIPGPRSSPRRALAWSARPGRAWIRRRGTRAVPLRSAPRS